MTYNKYAGIYAEKNGTFTIKTTLTYKDGYVKNITKRGFDTKTEALNYKNKLVDEAKNSFYFTQNDKNIKAHDFFDIFLEEYKLIVVISSKNYLDF